MLSALPLLASLLIPTAEAGAFKIIRIDPTFETSSDEICDNLKDDDGDGLVDEEPCVTGDFSKPWDKIGGTSGPGGSTFIPWENWLVAMDDTDGTLSVYEVYDVTRVSKTAYEYTFVRVVSGLDTIGLASSASEVTVGAADLDQDGSEDLALRGDPVGRLPFGAQPATTRRRVLGRQGAVPAAVACSDGQSSSPGLSPSTEPSAALIGRLTMLALVMLLKVSKTPPPAPAAGRHHTPRRSTSSRPPPSARTQPLRLSPGSKTGVPP
jgi:hypothetical protein